MRITFLILVGFLLIALGSFAVLARKIRNQVEVQYSQASEETLVDFAHLLASIIETDLKERKIDADQFREGLKMPTNADFSPGFTTSIKTASRLMSM